MKDLQRYTEKVTDTAIAQQNGTEAFIPGVKSVVEVLDKIEDAAQSIARIQNQIGVRRRCKILAGSDGDDRERPVL